MPATEADPGAPGPVYLSAFTIVKRYGVSHPKLLTLVASKLVGVLLEPGYAPQYSEQDILALLSRDPRQKRVRKAHKVKVRA